LHTNDHEVTLVFELTLGKSFVEAFKWQQKKLF